MGQPESLKMPLTETTKKYDHNTKEKALAVKGLVKTYKGSSVPALSGLDISVNAGEIFGLLGPNGAGKTTAISIMSTLLQPTSGSVIICGIDAVKQPNRIKKLIGLVPQDIALYANLTVRENLRYFGRLTAEETAQALEVSVGTIEREWRYIRAWLRRALEVDRTK